VLAIIVVATYAVMARTNFDPYLAEFAFAVAAVVGIGTLVAAADPQRPFVKVASLSFITIACLQCLSYLKMAASPTYLQPAVLPPAAITILSDRCIVRDVRWNSWSCRPRGQERPSKARPTVRADVTGDKR
jgi:hypothetical protein